MTAILALAVLILVGIQILLGFWIRQLVQLDRKHTQWAAQINKAIEERDRAIAALESRVQREKAANQVLLSKKLDEIMAVGSDDPGSVSRALRDEFERLRELSQMPPTAPSEDHRKG